MHARLQLKATTPTHGARGPGRVRANTGVGYAGNQSALRKLSRINPRAQFQPKVGAAIDPPEAEADRVADEVMRMREPVVNRRCAECEEEDARKVRTKNNGQSQTEGAAPSIVRQVLNSPGQPLEAAARDYLEPRFGFDLSRVKIHTTREAVSSAAKLNARAFTVGPHIAFGQGEYAPGTGEGRRLIAHELTHVVQQGGRMAPTPLTVSQPDDRFEREAGKVATHVVGGGSAPVRIGASAGGAVPSLQRDAKPAVVTVGDLPDLDPEAAFDQVDSLIRSQLSGIQAGLDNVTGGDAFTQRAKIIRDRLTNFNMLLDGIKKTRASKAPAEKIGFAYEALLFLSQTTQLETNFLIVSSLGQVAGVPFGQLDKNFEIFGNLVRPLQEKVLSGTPQDLAQAVTSAKPVFEQVSALLTSSIQAIQNNAALSKKVVAAANIAMIAINIYQLLKTPTIPDFPTSFNITGGGAAAATAVGGVDLAKTVAAIKELVKIGAMDPVVVSGVGVLGAKSGFPIPELEAPQVSQMAKFTPDETKGLNDFFGRGVKGATDREADFKVPAGLTREVIERYADIARQVIASGKDTLGVQALRLKLCLRALAEMK